MTMTIEQAVLEKLRVLPPEQQRQVLDFTEFLHHRRPTPRQPLKSLEGALAHFGVKIGEQDIAAARRKMWGDFPRDPNP